jgi:hypothetical protein
LLASKYADRVIVIDDGSSDRQLKLLLTQGAGGSRIYPRIKEGMDSKTGFEAAEGA